MPLLHIPAMVTSLAELGKLKRVGMRRTKSDLSYSISRAL